MADSGRKSSGSGKRPCLEFHRVVAGDLCFSIAQMYGLPLKKLQELNARVNCDKLKIQSGDTCHSISVAYKTNVSELMQRNGGEVDCNKLHVGRRLCVWSGAIDRPLPRLKCTERRRIVSGTAISSLPNPTLWRLEVVKIRIFSGDTCWGLSQAKGITVDELQLLNSRMNCSILQ
ncbi:LysM domain protein, partial [Ancylostoma duodenale]